MKKFITAMLIAAMSLSLVACGNKSDNNETTTEAAAEVATSAEELLLGAYDVFAEKMAPLFECTAEEVKGAFMGGYYDENDETTLKQGPGMVPVTDPSIMSIGLLPEANVAMVDDAALVQHMMMTNNFATMAFHVTDAANVDAVATALDEAIKNNQWICGQPEGYVVIKVGSYVVSCYGLNDYVGSLKEGVTTSYESAAVVAEGSF